MKQNIKRTGRIILILTCSIAALALASGFASDGDHNPIQQVLALLKSLSNSVKQVQSDVTAIKNDVGGRPSSLLSTGPFGLPANAASVDWFLVNDSTTTQTVTVTVFKLSGIGPKTAVAPGALTVAIGPDEVLHNANSVGLGQPFEIGFDYEVILEATNSNVLPSAVVWQDFGNTQIPGTLIPAGSWVHLQ